MIRNKLENSNFGSKSRSIVFKGAIILLAAVFIGRLAQLQIIKGTDYKTVSQAQAIKKVRVEPFRGHIYDRNGKLIVHNKPSFVVTMTRKDFEMASMPLLSSILEMDSATIMKKVHKFDFYNDYTPIKINRDLEFEKVALLEEYNDRLPGIEVKVESKRLYDFEGNMAHVLGYVREISAAQIEKLQYRKPGDLVGQTGLERTFDKEIRGNEGTKFVAVNKFGQKVASFEDGTRDIPAKKGFDLYLTIDIELQELAEKLLKGKRGCVVGMDPRNGEVRVLASKPDYDLRKFSGKVESGLYSELVRDSTFPLLHRSIQSQYPPGSTWKMLIALAALQEGVIDKNSLIHSPGSFQFGGRTFGDHAGAGSYNVRRAVQTSCNVFFYKLGLRIGYDIFEKYGKMFGFGQKTGIDLPNEKQGLLPTRDWLLKRYGKHGATKGRLVNYGIGQGEIMATPLQMARYVSTIANRGILHQPHLVNSIYNNMTNKIEPLDYKSEELPIDDENFEPVIMGMSDAVNAPGGTSWRARVKDVEVCGKTGTAQNPHGKDHAWFVCFAPRENPELALAVFIENIGYGGVHAAPIAQKIMEKYFYPDSTEQEKIPKDTLQISSN